MKEPTLRFSDRVENYVKYRPSYPAEVLDILKENCRLTPLWDVADIGSGTGIFTRLLVENGNNVFAVEPNAGMRKEAEKLLNMFPNFHSINAPAEATTLKDHSIQLITAAQAFHWFNNKTVRAEFERILKDKGWISLIWNNRSVETEFEKGYENLLLKYASEYTAVNHRNQTPETIEEFFLPGSVRKVELKNSQSFDFEGLKGRLLSSSYTPEENDIQFKPMLKELKRLFSKYNLNNSITFNYKTELYFGQLSKII